jgi:integrase
VNRTEPGYCTPGTVKRYREGLFRGRFSCNTWRETTFADLATTDFRSRADLHTRQLVAKEFTVYGKTKRECETALQAKRTELQEAHHFGRDGDTSEKYLSQLMTEWLDETKSDNYVELSTRKNAEQACRRILDALGDIPIRRITRSLIHQAVVRPTRSGEIDLMRLREMLNYAIPRYLTHNEAATVKPARRQAKVRTTIPDDDLRQLFAGVAGDASDLAFYYLSALRGARLGEMLALKWERLDAAAGTLAIVEKSPVYAGQSTTIKNARTGAGERVVTLDATAIALLGRLRDDQLLRGYAGPWIFPAPEGGRYGPTAWRTRRFAPVMRAAGLLADDQPLPWTHHNFRHTAVSRDMALGVPVHILTVEIGHANPQGVMNGVPVTTRGYTHSGLAQRREWVATVGAVLSQLLPVPVFESIQNDSGSPDFSATGYKPGTTEKLPA